MPKSEPIKREVWNFGEADWARLEEELKRQDWAEMQDMRPDDAAEFLTSTIIEQAEQCIGRKTVRMPRSSHPWLNDRAINMIQAKNAAEGTAEEKTIAEKCSKVILEEQQAWITKTKQEMHNMRSGSKQWWAKSRQLLDSKTKVSSIPALKKPDGEWEFDPQGKAEMLADTFTKKYGLAELHDNKYSTLENTSNNREEFDVRLLQLEDTIAVLDSLREDSATGPDMLPTRILRRMSSVLARPVLLLARTILAHGRWPECWLEHWVVPLYKINPSLIPKITVECISAHSCPKSRSD